MELQVVTSTGNYTGTEFVYGPYDENTARQVYERMIVGQSQHTTKAIRPYVEGEKITQRTV